VDELGRRNPERVGDVEQPLVEHAAATGFHGDQNGAIDAGPLRQLLLGQPSFESKPTDGGPDPFAAPLPQFDALGFVLTRSGGHLHKKWT
jgi:hypothetical protein